MVDVEFLGVLPNLLRNALYYLLLLLLERELFFSGHDVFILAKVVLFSKALPLELLQPNLLFQRLEIAGEVHVCHVDLFLLYFLFVSFLNIPLDAFVDCLDVLLDLVEEPKQL